MLALQKDLLCLLSKLVARLFSRHVALELSEARLTLSTCKTDGCAGGRMYLKDPKCLRIGTQGNYQAGRNTRKANGVAMTSRNPAAVYRPRDALL